MLVLLWEGDPPSAIRPYNFAARPPASHRPQWLDPPPRKIDDELRRNKNSPQVIGRIVLF